MPDIRQNLSRIHHHWVQKYRLDRYEGVVREVPARSLLVADHYDLFSKLYYAQNRKTRRQITFFRESMKMRRPVSLGLHIATRSVLLSYGRANRTRSKFEPPKKPRFWVIP